MPGHALDRDRVVAAIERSVLESDEGIVDVIQQKPDQLWVRTDWRGLKIRRESSWRLAGEAWVDDVLSVEGPPRIGHMDPQLFGLVYDREGQEYFLGFCGEGLAELGRRLVLEPEQGGISALAFAEVLALFRTELFMQGELVEDLDVLTKRYPEFASVSGLHPVSRHRGEDGRVELEFYSVVGYGGAGQSGYSSLVIKEWAVLAIPGEPATWETRDFFTENF